ncbi:MAG: type II toxin-antitoxin system VapC family toxin [Bacteroidota bacterium]|nr:type II toxin-antitoxin system VapC family toxin [Bacteroidota bacterium]
MKIFLDTSSLIKLYHTELGTDDLDRLLDENSVEQIFLAEIAKIEFNSAVWKKVRTKDLTKDEAVEIIDSFQSDYPNYSFISTDHQLLVAARDLIAKYGYAGLRTLDSIQLASILSIKEELSLAATADELLRSLIEKEGVKSK